MESKLDVEPPQGVERRGIGTLDLREDPDGVHHYLNGRRLYTGAEIEILLAGAVWLRGIFEWRGIPVVWPALRVDLAGRVSRVSDRKLSTAMPIPPTAMLRWVEDDDDED
jgi:hypothetical protein